jgi:carboxymethylenebutenolidase
MANEAVWRSGGLAVGLVAGMMLARGASLLSAHPADRPTADVRAESIKYASGMDSITAYIAYPEQAESVHAVLVIDETFGVPDFVRDATKRLAQKGFVALAPDLLSRRGGTPANADGARKLLASLNADTIMQDLDAAATYIQGLKVVNGTQIGVIGFGWGGGASLRYAAHNPSVGAFVVCYGSAPKAVIDFTRIKGTGFGVYADRDGQVTQGLYNLVRDLQKVDVDYRFRVYPNTGHGFLRTGQPPQAAVDAWDDITRFLHAWLKT